MTLDWLTPSFIITFIVGAFACVYYYHNIKKIRVEMATASENKMSFWAKLKPRLPLIIACIAFLTTFFLLGYFVGTKMGQNAVPAKKRIVMLFPLDEEKEAAYLDGLRQLEGFIEVIKETPTYTEQFEFVIRDSKLDAGIAEDIVKHEITQGTKIFVCTMSKVCTQLSEKFPSLIQNIQGDKPILISTVASSPKIKVAKNTSYRFYVRSKEEGETLANCAISNNYSKATSIAVNDDYGYGAVEQLKAHWISNGKNWTEGIHLERSDDFQLRISDLKRKISPDSVIFIVHYGNGIDKIVKALDALGMKNPIFATSTLSVKAWREPIESNLRNFNWFTCVPNYSRKNGSEDVIEDFVKYSLKRTIESILALEKEPAKSFDDHWWIVEVPDNLKISQDNGDIIVPMKCVSKAEFEVRK